MARVQSKYLNFQLLITIAVLLHTEPPNPIFPTKKLRIEVLNDDDDDEYFTVFDLS